MISRYGLISKRGLTSNRENVGNFSKRDGRREREQDFAELFSENWLSVPELRYRGFLSLMFPVVNVLFILSISSLFLSLP